jgi:hypothetical protein
MVLGGQPKSSKFLLTFSTILAAVARKIAKQEPPNTWYYACDIAGDFDLALRGLLGEGAPVSASTVARLKEQW